MKPKTETLKDLMTVLALIVCLPLLLLGGLCLRFVDFSAVATKKFRPYGPMLLSAFCFLLLPARGQSLLTDRLLALAPPPVTNRVAVNPNPTNAVAFVWGASLDASVVGYRIYYGPASGTYTNSAAVGNVTNAVLTNFRWGATYYFAATAYESSGLESPFSNEASYTVPPAPQPVLSIAVERFKIEWAALAGVSYTLQWSTNLARTNWVNHALFLSNTNAQARFLVTNDSLAKLWRVTLP